MKKEELEAALASEDAVMGDGILKVLSAFIKAKGTPSAAIELLSRNYVGYGTMASLVCSWLQQVDADRPITDADMPNGSQDAIMPPPAGRGGAKDEFDFLADLIKERFKGDAFNLVKGKGPPPWLDAIINTARGRHLIYDLSAAHTNCLLLNFAMQRILLQGHDLEVASIGTSLAGYFGVYHRLLARNLAAALTATPAELPTLLHELRTAASQGLHTYAYTQAVIAALSHHHGARTFTCISQEVSVHAAAASGNSVYAMLPMFAHEGEGDAAAAAAALVGRLMAATDRNAISPADIQHLVALYRGAEPPPMRLLHHPRLFELLIDSVFTLSLKPSQAYVDAALELLSMAASLCDEDLVRPQPSEGEDVLAASPNPDDSEGWADAAAARKGLAQSRALLHAAFSIAYKGASIDDIDEAVQPPVAAAALTRAIHAALRDEDFYSESYNLAAVQHLLAILFRIARRHPRCHQPLIDLVVDALAAIGSAKQDCAKAFLQLLLQLLHVGRTQPVMAAIQKWARSADLSLVRLIVFEILKACKAPYSPFFAGQLLSLMTRSGVRRRRDQGQRSDQQSELLTQFASDVRPLQFEPPLPARERAFLQELSNELYY